MVNSAAMMNEEEFAALGIGVPGYVPSCSSVSKTDNIADAVAFNPLSWEYYKVSRLARAKEHYTTAPP